MNSGSRMQKPTMKGLRVVLEELVGRFNQEIQEQKDERERLKKETKLKDDYILELIGENYGLEKRAKICQVLK